MKLINLLCALTVYSAANGQQPVMRGIVYAKTDLPGFDFYEWRGAGLPAKFVPRPPVWVVAIVHPDNRSRDGLVLVAVPKAMYDTIQIGSYINLQK